MLGGAAIPLGLAVGCVGSGLTLYLLRDAFHAYVNYAAGSDVQMRLVLQPHGAAPFGSGVPTHNAHFRLASRAARHARSRHRRHPPDQRREAQREKGQDLAPRRKAVWLRWYDDVEELQAQALPQHGSEPVPLRDAFITASSFCAYLTNAVNTASGREESADITYDSVGEDRSNPDEQLVKLTAVDGITEAA